MNVLGLCEGIGALALGLERAGMTVVGQVEIDRYCQRVLAKHWPEVPRHDDVRTAAHWWLDGTPRPAVDVISAGFPCQPASQAGRRRGSDDERWLWPDVWTVIDAIRPPYVLLENVPGLLTLRPPRGRGVDQRPVEPVGLGAVLRDLAQGGYDAQWDCVPAAAVGAPHRRDRVWIVAKLADADRAQRRPAAGDALAGAGSGATRFRASESGRRGSSVADTASQRRQLRRGRNPAPAERSEGDHQPAGRGAAMAYSHGARRAPWEGLGRPWPTPVRDGWWTPEPRMGRDFDGPAAGVDRARVEPWERGTPRLATKVPNQVERLRGIGNAVVPQAAEHAGRILLDLATQAGGAR